MEIKLRQFISANDGPLIAAWAVDPVYRNYFRNCLMPPSYDDCLNYPRWGGNLVLMVTKTSPEETIGMVEGYDLDLRAGTIKTGVLIEKEYQKKSLGHDAQALFTDYIFNQVGVRKVIVEFVDEYLVDAYQKVGFALEGKFLKEKKVGGSYLDEYRMGCFAENWTGYLKGGGNVSNQSSRERA